MDVYKKVTKPPVLAPTSPSHISDPGGNGHNASVAPLITMIAVLAIILIFCFCGAPAIREFCRKRVCTCCPLPDEERAGSPTEYGSSTPTIILLPFGRMLVVDRSVFSQFQGDEAGVDFMELSANLIRAHHQLQYASSTSILDSETTSKGLSPVSLGLSPPAYEDIFKHDLPPSYSELSLLFQQHLRQVQDDYDCVQTASSGHGGPPQGGRKRNNNRNSNEQHIISVLHVEHEASSRRDAVEGFGRRQRTESDTNINKKYRVLSKQSSF